MKKTIKIFKRTALLLVVASTYRFGYAQTPKPAVAPVTIRVSSHRPLSDALDQLQQTILSPINFEEAQYQSSKDLGMRRTQTVSGPVSFVFPLGGAFAATLSSGDSDPLSSAQTVVNAYNSAGLAGTYRAVKEGNRVDIVPSKFLATDGVSQIAATPVMSRLVSFESAPRSVLDTVQLIADTLSAASGVKVVLASAPAFLGATVTVGANNQPANEVLFAAFAQVTPASLYYRLLYDPAGKAYYLTVRGTPFNLGAPAVPVAQRKRTPTPASPNSPFFKKIN